MTLSVSQRIAVRFLKLLGSFKRKNANNSRKTVRAAKNAALNSSFNEPVEKTMQALLYKGRFVTDQMKLSAMRFGKSDVGYAGCEIISVFNAMNIFGSKPDMSLTKLIPEAETMGLLVRKGRWGTNPYLLDRLAPITGLSLTMVFSIFGSNKNGSLDCITETPGVYIASFWNNKKLMSGVHTVCFEVTSGEIKLYNYRYADRPYSIASKDAKEKLFAEKPLFLVYSIQPAN